MEALFDHLRISHGFCVEFGAWDGILHSNAHNLIRNHGWDGVLIEGDEEKFRELERNMGRFDGVELVRAMVGFQPSNGLDRILADAGAPIDFDLLSIDVDGNDYHVWDAMKDFRPKVVVIEYNPTIPNHIEFVQRRDMSCKQGNGLRSLNMLAESKGYAAVAVTPANVVFVREEAASEANIPSPSLDVLKPWHDGETSLLHLLDGTVVLSGLSFGPWNGVEMHKKAIQIVPRLLRVYPPDASRVQSVLLFLMRLVRRRHRSPGP